MSDYLMHYGILGMKWGIRRYQNKDGSLTDAGRKRYDVEEGEKAEKAKRMIRIRSTKKSTNYSQDDARNRVLDISDDDLRKTINRLELEKRYKELTTEKVEDGHQKYMRFMEKLKTGANTGVAIIGFITAFNKLRGAGDSAINKVKDASDSIKSSSKTIADAVKKEAGIKDKEKKKEKKLKIAPVSGLSAKVAELNKRITAMHSDERTNYLAHYGIRGQRHGVRRFQNEDGSYTAAGRQRYGIGNGAGRSDKVELKELQKMERMDKAKETGSNKIQKPKVISRSSTKKASKYDKSKYDNEIESARKDLLDVMAKKFGVNSPQYVALLEDAGGRDYIRKLELGEAVSRTPKPYDSELVYDKNSEYRDKLERREDSKAKTSPKENTALARLRDAVLLEEPTYPKSFLKAAKNNMALRNGKVKSSKSKTAKSNSDIRKEKRKARADKLNNLKKAPLSWLKTRSK